MISIRSLIDSADLVIAGTVESVQQVGAGSILLNGREYDRRDFQADISVDETIKGEQAGPRIVLRFATPSADIDGNVAGGGLDAKTHRVIFLRKTESGFVFVSPYYPSIPASSVPCGPNWPAESGGDAYRRVLEKLVDVLCADSAPEEKRSALFALNPMEDSAAAPFLKAALSLPNVESDQTLRVEIVTDLLLWKDSSVLPLAEQVLFNPSLTSPFFPKSNLVLAISGLDPKDSIPLLARVLKLSDPEERVAAARFLEYTHSPDALDVILASLDDTDRDVQFAVMQSLGNLTKQYEWRPATVDSDTHWNACLQHWREFETQRKNAE